MTTHARYPDRTSDDDWLWLEEIYDDKVLAWVDDQNSRTLATLDGDALKASTASVLEVLDSDARIPQVTARGGYLYNFWRDAHHPKGLWRRTTLDSYRTDRPDWDILLDVDALAAEDGTDWVWMGSQLLFPDFERALIRLSPDGGDAVHVREFDVEAREFVVDGFDSPYAKQNAYWIDRDALWISTDFGPDTLTTSSYARQVRRWTRGEPLESAELILEVPRDHMLAAAYRDYTPGFERDVVMDRKDFYHGGYYIHADGKNTRIDVPDDADVSFHREWMTIELHSDWELNGTTYPSGSLLGAKASQFLSGDRQVNPLFTPTDHASMVANTWTRNYLLITVLDDVMTRIDIVTPGETGWERSDLGAVKPYQMAVVSAFDELDSDQYWIEETGYLQPTTLKLGTVGGGEPEIIKTTPSFFDESQFTVEQHFASSTDGTQVPYFQIAPKDAKLDGSNPTVLRGYGGFQIPQVPSYDASSGRTWLERGGVVLIANIRGGGEYGPRWHQSALRENRHRAYEDFAAVAQDAIDRGLTSAGHLGCMGGSNGGLLVGNMLTHYPELFGAIVCTVPLLDMKRYTSLSAGTSWIAEYGDPDIEADWEFIQTFSPYHNLRDGVAYPPVLFYTATSDDRVGPVQARKMVARMQQREIPGAVFYENRQGGHGGAADNAQRAHMVAMSMEFLWKHLS